MEAHITPEDFLWRIEQYWEKAYQPDTKSLILGKMRRFGHDEIARLYDYLVENSKFLPKLRDIYVAAEELGVGGKKPDRAVYTDLAFPVTSCEYCRGVGFHYVYLRNGADGEKILLGTAPQGRSWIDAPADAYQYISRCSCAAGERAEKFAPRVPQFREWAYARDERPMQPLPEKEEEYAALPF